MNIPKKFCRGTQRPVSTVKALIRQLQQLPPELPIGNKGEKGRVVVYNVSYEYPFLALEVESTP